FALRGARTPQSQQAGEDEGSPRRATRDRSFIVHAQIEGEVEDDEHKQSKQCHAYPGLLTAQFAANVFPEYGKDLCEENHERSSRLSSGHSLPPRQGPCSRDRDQSPRETVPR